MRRHFILFCLILLALPLSGGRMKRKAPELSFSLPGGETFEVQQHQGKVLLLEVMLTTCPYCKECARVIEKLYRELGPRGFQPAAVAVNDDAASLVEGYAREQKLSFPVGHGERESVFRFLRLPVNQPAYTPILVFVDRKGMIRAQYMGTDYFFKHEERNIRELLEELLAEPAD